jgi:hypothetical protein
VKSRNAVGIAPLVAGLSLLGASVGPALDALRSGVGSIADLAALTGAVGSLAAIAVGAGVLLGWRPFAVESEPDAGREGSSALLLGIAAITVALGVAGALL